MKLSLSLTMTLAGAAQALNLTLPSSSTNATTDSNSTSPPHYDNISTASKAVIVTTALGIPTAYALTRRAGRLARLEVLRQRDREIQALQTPQMQPLGIPQVQPLGGHGLRPFGGTESSLSDNSSPSNLGSLGVESPEDRLAESQALVNAVETAALKLTGYRQDLEKSYQERGRELGFSWVSILSMPQTCVRLTAERVRGDYHSLLKLRKSIELYAITCRVAVYERSADHGTTGDAEESDASLGDNIAKEEMLDLWLAISEDCRNVGGEGYRLYHAEPELVEPAPLHAENLAMSIAEVNALMVKGRRGLEDLNERHQIEDYRRWQELLSIPQSCTDLTPSTISANSDSTESLADYIRRYSAVCGALLLEQHRVISKMETGSDILTPLQDPRVRTGVERHHSAMSDRCRSIAVETHMPKPRE